MSGQPYNFTIAPSGFVGVGTSQPSQRLHVQGDIFSVGTVTASNLVITGDYVFFNTVTSNIDPFIISNQQQAPALTVTQGAGVSPAISIAEYYSATNGIALKVAGDGNVGIGTDLPVTKLHVMGDVTCALINGNASNVTGLAPSAKVDTTNATNITLGTLAAARLPSQMLATTFNGNVGVGTTQPQATFEVRGSTTLAAPPTLPPVPLTAVSSTVRGSGLARYDGTYAITASPGSVAAANAFNYDTNTVWRTDANFNPSYAPLAGAQSTVAGDVRYSGDFLQITLPAGTFMYAYTLVRGSDVTTAPVSWYVFGTNDGGASFTLLHSIVNSYAFQQVTTQTFLIQSTVSYTAFRIVVSRVVSGTRATLAGWYIQGDTTLYRGARITGNLALGATSDVTRVVVNNTGVGIGTTVPRDALHLGGSDRIRLDGLAGFPTPMTTLAVDVNGVVTVATSDARLKTNVAPLRYGLEEVMKLRPVEFDWADPVVYGSGRDCGLIAQDVATVIPEIVAMRGADDVHTLDYVKLIPVLVRSIQELKAEVDRLRHAS